MQLATYKTESLTFRNVVGALYFVGLAAISIWKWRVAGGIYFILLAFRFLLLGYFTSVRLPASKKSSPWQAAFSYGTVLIPLAYSTHGSISTWGVLTSNLLFILGYSIAALAAIELGPRFGISPAVRGEICKSGVYRWFNHPMYMGYAIAEFGWVLVNLVNIPTFALSMLMQLIRARIETKLLLENPR